MSENRPSNPQFVGQGDASKQSREALPKDEFVLNAEQKQVVDVMQTAGKELESAELGARETAAGKLKELHGKELVDAGVNMMRRGVWEGVKSRLLWGIGGSLIGAVAGGLYGSVVGKSEEYRQANLEEVQSGFDGLNMPIDEPVKDFLSTRAGVIASKMIEGAGVGTAAGGIIGFETSGLHYNKNIAAKNNLPPVKWYDWVISNGVFGLTSFALYKNNLTARNAGAGIAQLAFNPVTVAGMRAVGKGLWEMRTPQRA